MVQAEVVADLIAVDKALAHQKVLPQMRVNFSSQWKILRKELIQLGALHDDCEYFRFLRERKKGKSTNN